jgi:DNA-binding CsgD family transcriptional regulator
MVDGLGGLLRLRATEGGDIQIFASPPAVEAQPRSMGRTCGSGIDAADTKISNAGRAIRDCIGTLAGGGAARELRVLGQDARWLGTANRKRIGNAMAGQMEGYVYLSRLEEQKAREFFRQHRYQIPDMDEGDSVGGKPLVCGLQEHRITGRLVIPRPMMTRQLRRTAVQAAGLTDRQWKIWNLHCRGNSQCRIAAKLGVNKSTVCRLLKKIESKITAARKRARKAGSWS